MFVDPGDKIIGKMAARISEKEKEQLKHAGEIVYENITPEKDPVYTPMPSFVSDKVISLLSARGIRFLYQHQLLALEAEFNKNNVILSTGTASGKSLCYQIPIMEYLLRDPDSTMLLIFPTKALTQDQRKNLASLIPEKIQEIAIYDGDTPPYQRAAIRRNARVILTNPDMLHNGMLPFHPSWARFFENLKLVVLDEAHIYRGVFGAHTANVIRRLIRVHKHYNQSSLSPQFILCSATLSNAKQLAEKLVGSEVTEFSQDTSGNGVREIFFLNPPIVDEALHLRAGSIYTAAKVAEIMEQKNRQVLLFCQSRQSVESTVRRLRDIGINADGYRSGYLSKERRKIENGLKEGSNRCVVATNALELGMDIGGMDSILSIGYPGSIASYYQRMGRAGRNHQPSDFIMIASQNPIDQYLMKHPDYITEQKAEPALIDPDNLLILYQHLQCALSEVPFSFSESYGGLTIDETQELLESFCSMGIARKSSGHFYWLESSSPQHTISLRNSGLDRISIVSQDFNGKKVPVGDIDRPSAYWMVHEGAIYFHNGESYRIDELNLDENTAFARPIPAEYTTEADKKTTILTKNVLMKNSVQNADLSAAEVTVTTQVIGYKKRDIETNQILGSYPLDLPQEKLETKAFILNLSDQFREELRINSHWTNDPNQYGPNWFKIRKTILERDHFQCQLCSVSGTEQTLHVHHIIPFRNFTNPVDANQPENLTTLCHTCHDRVEAAVKMRSGLTGFASAFRQISALFLECDANDLNVISDPACAEYDGKATIYLYETIPGGIGLSQNIFYNFIKIVSAVKDLIENCDCEDGCPGCVGPAGEIGIGGKEEAVAIASGLLLL